ncbi:EAL domain-containing protein [Tamilnaduibacter salinus]|uniref:EAL domain-containing protein n=1 Tax=Tamilnaduibacter salinus TaxID=1484056 RepID=UPI001D176EC4|nr:EAL domain-containing protein [Tamilnaduibacter salinus]
MKELYISRQRPDADAGHARRTLVRIDDDGIVQYVDAHSDAVCGFDPQELTGQRLSVLAASGEDDPLNPVHEDRFDDGQSVRLTLRHKEGFYFTALVTVRVAVGDADEPVQATITPRGNTPLDPRLLNVAEGAGQLGVWQLDVQSNRITWSDGLYRLFDLRPGTPIAPEHALYYFQDQQQRVRALFRRCVRAGRDFSCDLDILTDRQRLRPVRLTGRALYTGERITAVAGTLVDLSERLSQRAARTEAEQILHGMMAVTDDLVMAVDPSMQVLAVNQRMADRFEETFGLRPHPGTSLNELLTDFPNERRLAQRLWERAMEREQFTVEMPLSRNTENLPVYEFRYQRLHDRHGHVLGALHLARDISDQRSVSDSVDYMNRHDPMTGLLNRRELLRRLKRALEQQASDGPSHALLYIDLDHVSRFNDTAGAGACDRYLRELTGMLSGCIRQRDTLARVAGDKFAVILDRCRREEVRRVADNLLIQIRDFRFEWQGEELHTSASGGLVPFSGAEPTASADELLALAADLCQTAKDAGRDRIHVHQHGGVALPESEAQQRLASLQACVRENRIGLMIQSMRPIASATWGEHVEVLARLDDGSDEPWLPNDFLPVAERFDLARDIDRRVIGKTMDWLTDQPLLEPRLKTCCFNLSLASVLDDSFPTFVRESLSPLRFAPECFCFEVREGDATQYPDAVTLFCDAMHEIGCRVALDGAGASVQSYSLAARLPVDVIKLDESIMRGVDNDPVQQVMVDALHRIAETAGKTTVAPFIESDDTLRRMRTMGIHFGQGYRLAPPRPISDLAPVHPGGPGEGRRQRTNSAPSG